MTAPGAAGAREVAIGGVRVGNRLPFALIAGPCQMESAGHAHDMCGALAEIAAGAGVGFIYKTSFDKANRTGAGAARGLGLEASLPVFAALRAAYGAPMLTDVHREDQCAPVAEAVDALQIPAFLCRQTDLLAAAARTGRAVNVKKGQFLAPWDMTHVVGKLRAAGCDRILLTERGASFGYNTLVSDMRALPVMAETGWPVVFDATHSVQQPGGLGGASGGERRHVPALARAAAAAGVAALFVEVHQDPDRAPSDGPAMLPLRHVRGLLETVAALDRVAKARPLGPVDP